MSRFLDQRELILVVLLLLLFDLNGFCYIITEIIPHKHKFKPIIYIISIIFLIFDMYLFHHAITFEKIPKVKFEVDIDGVKNESDNEETEEENNDDNFLLKDKYRYIEKIVANFIAVAILITVIACIITSHSRYTKDEYGKNTYNSTAISLVYSSPLILLVLLIAIYANFYL